MKTGWFIFSNDLQKMSHCIIFYRIFLLLVCHLCTDFLLYDAFIEYLKFLNLIKYVIAGLQNMRYDIYCFSISFLDAYQILKVPVPYCTYVSVLKTDALNVQNSYYYEDITQDITNVL